MSAGANFSFLSNISSNRLVYLMQNVVAIPYMSGNFVRILVWQIMTLLWQLGKVFCIDIM